VTNKRIYEKDTDKLFICAFKSNPTFSKGFVGCLGLGTSDNQPSVSGQINHLGNSGSIDIEVVYPNRYRFLIENKINAGYSTTRQGIGQPERYQMTVQEYQSKEPYEQTASVLLAPQVYLNATRSAEKFDHAVSYEKLRPFLEGADLQLLEGAIIQAKTPYEPVENRRSGNFFANYRHFVEDQFPALTMKKEPNARGVRPLASRTIYFDAVKTLKVYHGIPKPTMSLQCWDDSAPSASVKIMIGKWGRYAEALDVPDSLKDIGGHIRHAGQSLGIVINSPTLNTQQPFYDQVEEVSEGLEAALRLQDWWKGNFDILYGWAAQIG